jgi:glycerol-3-phosphate acyltransferase PlsX
MGSIFMEEVLEIRNPRVGLINVGTEESKGTDTVKQAYTLLKNSNINFIGNIEGRDLLRGDINVAVCDGFVGNVTLKVLEGAVDFFFGALKEVYAKNPITKLSGLAIKNSFKSFKKNLDYEEHGGVPLLGVAGRVIKCHGNSKSKAIKHSIFKSVNYARSSVLERIEDVFKNLEVDNIE